MARALLVHERLPDGGFRPVGIFYATPKKLDERHLPGLGDRDAWFRNVLAASRPPFLDGRGIDPERGTWEDWIEWANRSLGNGHDTWVTEVDADVTMEATYSKTVLGAEPSLSPAAQPTDELPELSGFKKVRPQ